MMYLELINSNLLKSAEYFLYYLSILAMSAAVGLLFKQVIAKISYDGESKY